MTLFFSFPADLPQNHPLREKARRMFCVRGFNTVESVIEASYVVEFPGGKPVGFPPQRRIIARYFEGPQRPSAYPQGALLVDLNDESVPMFDAQGFLCRRIRIKTYLQEFLCFDPVADSLL